VATLARLARSDRDVLLEPPAARGGRVVLLGLALDPFEAAELSEALALAAEEAAAEERLVIVPTD